MKTPSQKKLNCKILVSVIAGLAMFLPIVCCSETSKQAELTPQSKDTHLPYSVKDGDTTWIQVDQMPVFTGGDEGLMRYISENVKYPDAAKKAGIQGKVIIRFKVNESGEITQPSVFKGADPDLDKEALRVISILPRFEKPAIKSGKEVAVWYMLPISFALK